MGTMPGGMVKLLFFAVGGPVSKRRVGLFPWGWGKFAPDRPGRHRGGAGRGEASESDARRSGDTNRVQPTPRTSPVIAKKHGEQFWTVPAGNVVKDDRFPKGSVHHCREFAAEV